MGDVEVRARRHEGALYVAPEIRRELKLPRPTWGDRIGRWSAIAAAAGALAIVIGAAFAAQT